MAVQNWWMLNNKRCQQKALRIRKDLKMAKKKTEENVNLDSILFKCRDYLRAARNSGSFFEKRDMMLTLVFLRFIGEKFEDGIENLRKTLRDQGLDPDDENIKSAFQLMRMLSILSQWIRKRDL